MDDPFVSGSSNIKQLADLLTSLRDVNSATKREFLSRHNKAAFEDIVANAALTLSTVQISNQLFRKSGEANEAMRVLWFSEVLNLARSRLILSTTAEFRGLSRNALREIVGLSVNQKSLYSLPNILAESYGVILVYNSAYSSMKLDGVCTRLYKKFPVIGLSVRYSRYDNFWFTLMHELSHIHLHFEDLDEAIFDDVFSINEEEREIEANRCAGDVIMPRNLFNQSPARISNEIAHIYDLAERSGVHPALTAGAVRFQKNNYTLYQELAYSINVRSELGLSDD